MFANKLTQAIKQGKIAANELNTYADVELISLTTRPASVNGTGIDISFVTNVEGKAVPCLTLRNSRRTRGKPQ